MRRRAPNPLAILVALIALPVLVYLGDALLLKLRIERGGGLETLKIYVGTTLKSGKVEIFTDQTESEVCAHALFPHFGYRPCWYARRAGGVKVI